ncbi:hypothetical protein FKM82_018649 [Ascaphus truei]
MMTNLPSLRTQFYAENRIVLINAEPDRWGRKQTPGSPLGVSSTPPSLVVQGILYGTGLRIHGRGESVLQSLQSIEAPVADGCNFRTIG